MLGSSINRLYCVLLQVRGSKVVSHLLILCGPACDCVVELRINFVKDLSGILWISLCISER